MKLIDAHIHVDQYKDEEIGTLLEKAEALLSVSTDLKSCQRNLQLSKKYSKVKPAFGFHPEQKLIAEDEFNQLLDRIHQHANEMVAVGEVGLPYYLRQEQKVTDAEYPRYLVYLERFIELARNLKKPIVLHAVYEDAPIVCELLEKHSVAKAHFHWFKGDEKTIERMVHNGYYISVTPEVVYKEKIQRLVQSYPLEKMMIETDGPWPFEGPFSGKRTTPNMMKESIASIAKIKKLPKEEVSEIIFRNTQLFYEL